MRMPEAPIDKDGCPVLWEDNVWAPRQVLSVQTEPKAFPMKQATNNSLRIGVLGPYPAHELASLVFGENVAHSASHVYGHFRFGAASRATICLMFRDFSL